MKKTVIGSVFMLSGVLLFLGIIFTATINLSRMNGWPGDASEGLWFSIENLSLGVPFVFAILIVVISFIILAVEYFKKSK